MSYRMKKKFHLYGKAAQAGSGQNCGKRTREKIFDPDTFERA